MNHRYRLEQLHVLLARLEQLPPSPNRDWMMVEVRSRAADVETGVQPEPVRERNRDVAIAPSEATSPTREAPRERPREDAPEPHRREPPTVLRNDGSAVRQSARPDRVARGDGWVDPLERAGLLCLGDLPTEAPADAGHQVSPPWARGLRG
jgi:hypothetical protein